MREVVIVSAARTPFGKFGGGLSALKAVDLGAIAIKAAVERSGVSPEEFDYVYMGQVLQGGAGQIPSRQAARKAGLPWEVPSVTVNKVCASGLIAVAMAAKMIALGEIDVAVAGGMESMSNAPYILPSARWGQRMFNFEAIDLMVHDGLWCAFYDRHMAVHGSEVAKEYGISRQAQDEWAYISQMRAKEAMEKGRLNDEIVKVEVPGKKGEVVVIEKDEQPRPNTTIEALSKLPPVFDANGTVTAGNAPGVNDGAGALVLMSREKARELGIKPLATYLNHAEVALDAKYIATAPGQAINKLLAKKGMKIEQIDLLEVNEAFAAVVLVSQKIAGYNLEKVNVNGGAVAFGHPIGASGARILMTLIYELRRRGGGTGIAAICSGAAQGDAMLIKVE
ncbi:acetyl-CoA C-acetyltransferase [Carboxydothermus hydrogenoformans]|uniref:Acetyl-CoA acetyltransferase n=1 Tax=Carboxydothermus hydrogenoformans (strain ATCC BAA-161 / DSM 6008 / Z-2901) TaxID=246194 RepID=Q3ABQ2_CARHZ|nr:acetyl-CoA C-acetyltransferase [Carboxydothermus hydrogenoformans]ABB16200.1 acetyl-CoA acetyltransferase [Carboxydothermus hydrogenoformans Z-2901]